MKVLLINGSPHEKGCTYTALKEVENELNANDIETEWVWIGTGAVHGCIACQQCKKTGRCVFNDDVCNEIKEKLEKDDGVVIGSPVYFANINGALGAILDRVFFGSVKVNGKIGAGIISCRRSGSTASFDRLNKYFSIKSMPIATSQYWNAVHGNTPEEVKQDLEGLQTMRTLAKNMAWLIKSTNGKEIPEYEETIGTNFIR